MSKGLETKINLNIIINAMKTYRKKNVKAAFVSKGHLHWRQEIKRED